MTLRAVTVIMGAVVGLSFLFAFGNVWTLALRLGVPPYVAPLVAPSVDLSVVALLVATRFLSVHGASREHLRPARHLLIFAGCVTLALNVAEPLIAGQYGKAAFDSVGSWLLIGWAHVGPGLLQAMHQVGRPEPAPTAEQPSEPTGADQPETSVDLGDDTNTPDPAPVPQQRRAATKQRPGGSNVDEELLARARAEDARHWAEHHRPISAEALRKRLNVGAATSRNLVARIRSDTRSVLGENDVTAQGVA